MCTVAIYSRKSKFTGKGESIQNQIELCKEYAQKHFNTQHFSLYEDEGYSGGNVDRPMFKQLLEDIKSRQVEILICYRLDRISRNISDFSRLMELLEKYHVSFVSIREQFDTSTPMGRAMMYITSVFSHLERETIAERVKDHMHQLARTGRWLGGNTPMGYRSEAFAYSDHGNNAKKMYILAPISSELGVVKEIYNKYLQSASLTQVESWALDNNIKTKNHKNFDKSTLKFILTNPVYVIADELIYQHFKGQGADMASPLDDFDGKHGLMVFNKHNEKDNRVIRKDLSEWIIAVGKHPGVMSSTQWIRAQDILRHNREKAPRTATGKVGLLTALLRCGHCGSKMRVAVYRRKGGTYHYYRCLLKERSKGVQCSVENLNGKQADEYVVDKIKGINYEKQEVYQHLIQLNGSMGYLKSTHSLKKTPLEEELQQYREAIHNLTLKLSGNLVDGVTKYIVQQIKELDFKIIEVQHKINQVKAHENLAIQKELETSSLFNLINDFSNHADQLRFFEKKKLLTQMIDYITWDGWKLEVHLMENDTMIP